MTKALVIMTRGLVIRTKAPVIMTDGLVIMTQPLVILTGAYVSLTGAQVGPPRLPTGWTEVHGTGRPTPRRVSNAGRARAAGKFKRR
jgi:hypothetical protein